MTEKSRYFKTASKIKLLRNEYKYSGIQVFVKFVNSSSSLGPVSMNAPVSTAAVGLLCIVNSYYGRLHFVMGDHGIVFNSDSESEGDRILGASSCIALDLNLVSASNKCVHVLA
jgi:hypothetical protein